MTAAIAFILGLALGMALNRTHLAVMRQRLAYAEDDLRDSLMANEGLARELAILRKARGDK